MKKVALTLSALVLMSSAAMAAPVTNLEKGESVAGYSYWNAKTEISNYDLGNSGINGFYVETALNENFIVGIETAKGSVSNSGVSVDARFTDISLKYKLDKNLQLIAGNRNYDVSASYGGSSASASTDKFFYGIGATTEIGENTSAYASVTHSNVADDWQIGAIYNMSKETSLNINYRSYSEDGFSLKGVGAGLAYKF